MVTINIAAQGIYAGNLEILSVLNTLNFDLKSVEHVEIKERRRVTIIPSQTPQIDALDGR